MIYESLTLKKCKRYNVSKVDELVINFIENTLVILGTNGSGKSTTVSMMNIYPPNKTSFHDNGYWGLVIVRDGIRYLLAADFSIRKSYQFIVNYGSPNATNLNASGIITVQQKLTQEHFGISEVMMSLVLGKIKLYDLGPTQRKDIIQLISGLDMTYATALFKRLSTGYRDARGTYRNIRTDMFKTIDEFNKFKDENDISDVGMQEKYDVLLNDVNKLMLSFDGNLPGIRQALTEVESINNDIAHLGKQFNGRAREFKRKYNKLSETSVLQYKTTTLKNTILSLSTSLTDAADEVARLEQELKSVAVNDVGLVQDSINELESFIEKEDKLLNGYITTNITIHDLDELEDASSNLKMMLNKLPENPKGELKRSDLPKIEQERNDIRIEYNNVSNRIRADKERLSELLDKKAEEVKCTSCFVTFKPYYTEEAENEIRSALEKASELKEVLEEKLKTAMGRCNLLGQYTQAVNTVIDYTTHTAAARSIFAYVYKETALIGTPNDLIMLVDLYVKLSTAMHKKDLYKGELVKLKYQLELNSQDTKYKRVTLESNLNDAVQQVSIFSDELEQLNVELRDIQTKLVAQSSLRELSKELSSKLDAYDHIVSNLPNISENSFIKSKLNAMQAELAKLSTTKDRSNELSRTITIYENKLRELDSSVDVLSNLVKATSPTEGIIANQLLVFIDKLMQQVNNVVNSIYTYPLYILPPNVDASELDYKFPVISSGTDEIDTDDIANLSDGQKYVVNLAFRIVAIQRLGLMDFPLFLDEPTAHQDPAHVKTLRDYVKTLMDNRLFNGLVLIDHAAGEEDAFSNADFLVLEGSNITPPQNANKNVTLIRK